MSTAKMPPTAPNLHDRYQPIEHHGEHHGEHETRTRVSQATNQSRNPPAHAKRVIKFGKPKKIWHWL
jgi:hypothetical protein